MPRFSIPLVSLALVAVPAHAAPGATLQLTAIIPESCAVDLVGAQIGEHRLVIDVRRECNTAHNIVFASQLDPSLGKVTVHYNNVEVPMQSDLELIAQPEDYYDGVDRIVVDVTAGTAQDLARYAQSFNIGIDTA